MGSNSIFRKAANHKNSAAGRSILMRIILFLAAAGGILSLTAVVKRKSEYY